MSFQWSPGPSEDDEPEPRKPVPPPWALTPWLWAFALSWLVLPVLR